jgi:hypothetical protein
MNPTCVLAMLLAGQVSAAYRIGYIEFFGQKGVDVAAVRTALPIHEGDELKDLSVYIGLAGSSSHSFTYLPKPTGSARLPPELMKLSGRLDQGIEKAVEKGGDAAQEDDSQGYALTKDPDARAVELELRQYALKHEPELFRVLQLSSDAEQRGIACEALGYARQSSRQMAALIKAARDSDDIVRNNATRALGVLLRSNGKLASQVPADTFIEMIGSGTWTDRNKGAAVRVILGRIAGIPEAQLSVGPVQAIIDKVLSCCAP